jgi:hypothetical protein
MINKFISFILTVAWWVVGTAFLVVGGLIGIEFVSRCVSATQELACFASEARQSLGSVIVYKYFYGQVPILIADLLNVIIPLALILTGLIALSLVVIFLMHVIANKQPMIIRLVWVISLTLMIFSITIYWIGFSTLDQWSERVCQLRTQYANPPVVDLNCASLTFREQTRPDQINNQAEVDVKNLRELVNGVEGIGLWLIGIAMGIVGVTVGFSVTVRPNNIRYGHANKDCNTCGRLLAKDEKESCSACLSIEAITPSGLNAL